MKTKTLAELLPKTMESITLGSPSNELLETVADTIDSILHFRTLGIDVWPTITGKVSRMLMEVIDADETLPDIPDDVARELDLDNPKPAKKKSTLTDAGRKRLSRKLKASWARKRKEKAAQQKLENAATRKGRK